MPRMRTIDAAISLIRQMDKDTSLTKYALRRMVLSGEVPSVVVGKSKRLINVDLLMARLANPAERPDDGPPPNPGVRRADEQPRPGAGHGAGLHG